MKNIFTIIAISILSMSTMFSQNFGISLDNTIWSGDMVRYIYSPKVENNTSTNSVILGLNYNYTLSENLDVVASAGYAFGFEIIPLKANFNYQISDKTNNFKHFKMFKSSEKNNNDI